MSNRKNKREIITIDDDDSSSEQPVVKNKKREAKPISSSEVIKLQKKVVELERTVTKLDNNYKGACRIAGEAQARVQFLENLVDSKPKADNGAKKNEDELEKRVKDLTTQLEELRVDRITRLAELTNLLVVSRKETADANAKNRVLNREKDALKLEMAEMRRLAEQPKMQPLPPQLPIQLPMHQAHWGTITPVPSSEAVNLQKKVVELERKLIKLENNQTDVGPAYNLPYQANPNNMLQMCHPGALEAISLGSALKKLETLMTIHGRDKVFDYIRKRMMDENYMDPRCEVCPTTLSTPLGMLGHFLSGEHTAMMRSRGCAVSFAAYQHWFRPLQPPTYAATTYYVDGVKQP